MRYLVPILCLVVLAAAAPMKELRSGEVIVRFHPTDDKIAAQVLAGTGGVRQSIRDDLGIAFREPAVIVLARGEKDFRRLAGSDIPGWALAIAHTESGGIVIDLSRTGPLLENNLLFTLHHELVHLALGQVEREAGASLPLWFHEGVATWVSGTAHFTDRRPLIIAGAHGALIPLAKLTDHFPAEDDRARLAYLESEAFVIWLDQRGATPGRIVAGFRRDGDFPGAVARAAGEPLDVLEADWRESMLSPHPWLTSLLNTLSLFTILAVAVVIAYVILRIRRARLRRQMADEEAWMDSLPDSEWGDEEEGGDQRPPRRASWRER